MPSGFPSYAHRTAVDDWPYGQIIEVNGGTAGAGGKLITPPLGASWLLLCLTCRLSTAAGGGNRNVNLYWVGAALVRKAFSEQPLLHPPASAYVYCFYPENGQASVALANNRVYAQCPETWLINATNNEKLWLEETGSFPGDFMDEIYLTVCQWMV